jgi:hypothetical protein
VPNQTGIVVEGNDLPTAQVVEIRDPGAQDVDCGSAMVL